MDTIALILSIIGSLNWGLVGDFQIRPHRLRFSAARPPLSPAFSDTLVGLAGLWCISLLFRKRGSSSEADPAARTAPALRPSVPSTEGQLCTRCSARAQGSPERGSCRGVAETEGLMLSKSKFAKQDSTTPGFKNKLANFHKSISTRQTSYRPPGARFFLHQ